MIEITVEGIDETMQALDGIEGAVREAADRAVYLWSEGVMGQSKGECPVDTGMLRSSGFIEVLNDGGVLLAYPPEYAVYVHENMEAHHPTGKAKFLEDPVNRNVDRLGDGIAKAITQTLGGSP